LRAPLQEFEYRSNHDSQHAREQRQIECHPIPQVKGQRKYPLANRNRRNNAIDKMRGSFRHSSSTARRTKRTTLARIRQQPVSTALRAPEAQKAEFFYAASQKGSKRLFDEPRYSAIPFALSC